MHTADHIIRELGGPAALSRATRIPLTTIVGWKDANFVPEWRQPALLKIAAKLGKPIAADDFPPIEHRISRAKPASVEQAA